MGRMCGIFGAPPLAVRDVLNSFSMSGPKDGWGGYGISGYSGGRAVYFDRQVQAVTAGENPFEAALDRADRSGTPVLMAHLHATGQDTLAITDVQPFHSDDWILCHEGTIYGAVASLSLHDAQPQGGTDSERFHLWIVENVRTSIDPTSSLASLLRDFREKLVFSSLNFQLTDGKRLWAYREVSDRRLAAGETFAGREKQFEMFVARRGGTVLIAPEPWTTLTSSWTVIEQRTLVACSLKNPEPQLIRI